MRNESICNLRITLIYQCKKVFTTQPYHISSISSKLYSSQSVLTMLLVAVEAHQKYTTISKLEGVVTVKCSDLDDQIHLTCSMPS